MKEDKKFIIIMETVWILAILLSLFEGWPFANLFTGVIAFIGLIIFNLMLIDIHFFMKDESNNGVANNE